MKQHTSLFGHGITTRPLAKHLQNPIFFDDKCTQPYTDKEGYRVQPSSSFNPQCSTLEIPSPGLPPDHPLIQKAQHLISEYDYFAKTKPLKVWISGTNGKTTTTQMMQHLFNDKGALAGGNIGTPLAKLSDKSPLWILETSSFTMHYTNTAYPNVYVLLPLSPDHLSWHGSMQEYIKAKLKPLSMMPPESIAIIPKAYENTQTQAKLLCYEDENDLAKLFNIEHNKVKFKGAFLMDALLAMGVDKLLNNRISYEKINTFTLDPHRQEELFDKNKRLWVNDTKATNLDATKVAIQRYKNHFIHLILGGDDKGVDLEELFIFLTNKELQLYTIGSNKQKLATLAHKYNLTCKVCQNLEDAVIQIDKKLTKQEVALLSPAAASLDEFNSYAQRGEIFKECVKSL
jgi:UDP-N-acetylmuramoylalanine--D-glutamate ligase